MNARQVLAALVFALSIVPSTLVDAAGQKTVHVKPYTRKDGTHVAGHDRKAPEKRTSGTTAASPSKNERKESSVQPATGVARDEHGRIQRSDAARHAFARQTGYPNGRPGYVIDHIVPLACGGADAPGNMQWQTVAEAKAKDKTERVGCR
jgi:hypothetical protein